MNLLISLLIPISLSASFQAQSEDNLKLKDSYKLSARYNSDSLVIENISNEYLKIKPELWFTEPKSKQGNTDRQSLSNAMAKFSEYPVTPIVPPSSEEPHVPFNAYNFFGIAICDDAARVFSSMLSYNHVNTKIRSLNGHVATEVNVDGRFVYIDPYIYGYPTINGEFLTSNEIINLTSDDEFTHYNWKDNTEKSVTKSYSKGFYSIIGDDDWLGTEIQFPSAKNDSYELYPNDYIKISSGLDFLPYRASNNPIEIFKAKNYFSTLEVSRSFISSLKSKHSFRTIEMHNNVTRNNDEILFTGKNSQMGMHIESLSPVNGIIFSNSSFNSEGQLILKIYSDNKGLIGEAEITGKETEIEFSSAKNSPVIYNFTAYIISLGKSDESSSVVKKPILKIHSQITPTSTDMIKKQFL